MKQSKRLAGLVAVYCLLVLQTPYPYTRAKVSARPNAATGSVLICESARAYAYHKYQCRGLANCRASIIRVSVQDAVNKGRKECRICY